MTARLNSKRSPFYLVRAGSLEKWWRHKQNRDHKRSSRFALGDKNFNLDKV